MKKRIFVILTATVIIAATLGIFFGTQGESPFYEAGKNTDKYLDSEDGEIVASYKEHKITLSRLEYEKSSNSLKSEDERDKLKTDKDIINLLIKKVILLKEAERQGLSATQDEIDEMLASVKYSYELPDGKEIIDAYCSGAGITVDEYFALVEEQLPGTIARQKLKNMYYETYCEKHNEISLQENIKEQATIAFEDYCDSLMKENAEYIVYYID